MLDLLAYWQAIPACVLWSRMWYYLTLVQTPRINESLQLSKHHGREELYGHLVRSVKLALKKTVEHNSLTKDNLVTTIVEVETVLSSMLLIMYVYRDIGDLEAITPVCFLTGIQQIFVPSSC